MVRQVSRSGSSGPAEGGDKEAANESALDDDEEDKGGEERRSSSPVEDILSVSVPLDAPSRADSASAPSPEVVRRRRNLGHLV